MIFITSGPPQPDHSKKIMKASHAKITVNKYLRRFFHWSTVVLYTACLPYVIFVYRSIVNQFSPQITGRVSLFIIIALAAIYTIICIIKKMTARCLIVLAVSGIIVIFVMNFETNGLFVAACLALIVFHWRRRLNYSTSGPATKPAGSGIHTTAMLWVICPMTILMAMHALVLWVAVAGINFQ